jgi:hypothetical protein
MDKWTIDAGPGKIFPIEGSDKSAVAQAVSKALDDGATYISVSRVSNPFHTDDPPYGIIYSQFKKLKVVPFLGAGASFVARPNPTDEWTRDSNFPPSGSELTQHLAKLANLKEISDNKDLARVASYFAEMSSEPDDLRLELDDIFSRAINPGTVHELLAELPQPMLVVTTNYDTLTEKAFRDKKLDFDVVVHNTIRNNMRSVLVWEYKEGEPVTNKKKPDRMSNTELLKRVDLTKRTVIYKMHGSVDPMLECSNFVITEEDYVDFLAWTDSESPVIPQVFSQHCADRSFLFLGYGLRDWNFRVVLKKLRRDLPPVDRSGSVVNSSGDPRKHWAMQSNPSSVERTVWEARGVRIFNVDLTEFVREMRLLD